MNYVLYGLGIAAIVYLVVVPLRAATTPPPDPAHGQYLVEDVAMCVQCHSPRTEGGTIIRSQLLEGAAIPVASPPGEYWAIYAPRIAGLQQYSDEQALTLLTTGIARTGKPLRAPMPPFRMSPQDARDIIAYLRSLR